MTSFQRVSLVSTLGSGGTEGTGAGGDAAAAVCGWGVLVGGGGDFRGAGGICVGVDSEAWGFRFGSDLGICLRLHESIFFSFISKARGLALVPNRVSANQLRKSREY